MKSGPATAPQASSHLVTLVLVSDAALGPAGLPSVDT
jgi:hypothetical protein